MRKELTIIATIVIAIVITSVVVTFKCIGVVNQAIAHEEDIKRAKANIEIEEQRRFDLLPKLIDCIKEYSEYEYEILNKIAEKRAQHIDTTSIEKSMQSVDTISFKESTQHIDTISFEENSQGIDSIIFEESTQHLDTISFKGILIRIKKIVEEYPELKSTENYLNFRTELKATEDRISEKRNAYNWTVEEYNVYVSKIRHRLILELSSYEIKNYEYYDTTKSEIKDY